MSAHQPCRGEAAAVRLTLYEQVRVDLALGDALESLVIDILDVEEGLLLLADGGIIGEGKEGIVGDIVIKGKTAEEFRELFDPGAAFQNAFIQWSKDVLSEAFDAFFVTFHFHCAVLIQNFFVLHGSNISKLISYYKFTRSLRFTVTK